MFASKVYSWADNLTLGVYSYYFVVQACIFMMYQEAVINSDTAPPWTSRFMVTPLQRHFGFFMLIDGVFFGLFEFFLIFLKKIIDKQKIPAIIRHILSDLLNIPQ